MAVQHPEVYAEYVALCEDIGCFYDYPLIEELRRGLPTLIIRTGMDEGPLPNRIIDHFEPIALGQNLDFTLINVPGVAPAFDVFTPTDLRTQQPFAAILTFVHESLAC